MEADHTTLPESRAIAQIFPLGISCRRSRKPENPHGAPWLMTRCRPPTRRTCTCEGKPARSMVVFHQRQASLERMDVQLATRIENGDLLVVEQRGPGRHRVTAAPDRFAVIGEIEKRQR